LGKPPAEGIVAFLRIGQCRSQEHLIVYSPIIGARKRTEGVRRENTQARSGGDTSVNAFTMTCRERRHDWCLPCEQLYEVDIAERSCKAERTR
jgi:hypothetical protein